MLEAEGAPRCRPRSGSRRTPHPRRGRQPSYGSPSGVYETIEVKVPDIGDFKDVPVIEVQVQAGDAIKAEDPLITLESDKATMEMPSPAAGTVASSRSRSATGSPRATSSCKLREAQPRRRGQRPPTATPAPARASRQRRAGDIHAEVLVLGAGPGRLHRRLPRRRSRQEGRAGRALAEPRRRLPQRRLHPLEGAAARGQGDRRDAGDGARTASPSRRRTIDIDKLRGWKDGVVKRLTGGLAGLAKQRKVTVVHGHRPVRLARTRSRSSDGRRDEDRQLRPGDHRRRLGAGEAAVHPARRSARDRLTGALELRRRPEAPAGDRRRHHRAGDGDRLPRARRRR